MPSYSSVKKLPAVNGRQKACSGVRPRLARPAIISGFSSAPVSAPRNSVKSTIGWPAVGASLSTAPSVMLTIASRKLSVPV